MLSLAACGSDSPAGPGDAPVPPRETLMLPLRIHVLSSSVTPFDATFTDGEVQSLMARANEVWAQADIRFEVESIVHEGVANEAELMAVAAGSPTPPTLINNALPRGQLLSGRWDVFLMHDLSVVAGAPGVFFANLPAVVSSEVDPAGLNHPGRILAHELGHSLTLPHVPCTPEGNLMSPGCDSADRTRLSDDQIAAARAQASTGHPFGG